MEKKDRTISTDKRNIDRDRARTYEPPSWQMMKAWVISSYPIDLRRNRVAWRFERRLARYKSEFQELGDSPVRRIHTPEYIRWELQEELPALRAHEHRPRKGSISIQWVFNGPPSPPKVPTFFPREAKNKYCLRMVADTQNPELKKVCKAIFGELADDIGGRGS